MGVWESRVLPRLVDRSLGCAPVREQRTSALRAASGRVLELGFGSGTDLPHYPAGVSRVDAVEPSDTAWRMSADRRGVAPYPVVRVGLDGARVEVPDQSYDTAVTAFALCTIPDAAAALAEVRRALVTGGRLCLLEHGLAPEPGVARWQRRLEPWQRRVAGGCHLTRDPVTLVEDAGLEVVRLEQDYLPGPGVMRPWGYLTVLEAVRPTRTTR